MSEFDERDLSGLASGIGGALTGALGPAEPGTVFSEPTKVGDDLVITASAWERFAGFGFGGGHSESGEAGTGGGGGGGSQGRPVAVIRVTQSGVEVTPVIDFTKIGVTLLLGFIGVVGALGRGARQRT